MTSSTKSLNMIQKHPILKQLADARSYGDGLRVANKSLKLLGEGSARAVYDLGGRYVLKLAKDKSGIAQNKVESINTSKSKIINPILIFDPSYKWIITYKAAPITSKQFKQLTGMDFFDFGNALLYKFNQEDSDTWPKPSTYATISNNKFFQEASKFIALTDSQVGDLAREDLDEENKIQNWGLVKNRVVLTDFGLNREVFDKFYS